MNNLSGVRFLCTSCDRPLPLSTSETELRCPNCGREYSRQDGILLLGASRDPDDYPAELHDLLAVAEPRHFWFGERNRLILSTMREAFGTLAGRSVLDVGCGTGFVTAALERAGMAACGLDMNLAGLVHARRRMRGPLLCQDAARVPFVEQFDAAMLCDVIEHTPDDQLVLRETAHAVRPGGGVVVTVPAHPSLWSVTDETAGHKRRYTRASLRTAMERAGLRVRLVRPFNSLLLPLQILQRLTLNRRSIATQEERLALVREALIVPPRPINDLLRLAMSADLVLSRAPVTFGSSLIAIGQRPA